MKIIVENRVICYFRDFLVSKFKFFDLYVILSRNWGGSEKRDEEEIKYCLERILLNKKKQDCKAGLGLAELSLGLAKIGLGLGLAHLVLVLQAFC